MSLAKITNWMSRHIHWTFWCQYKIKSVSSDVLAGTDLDPNNKSKQAVAEVEEPQVGLMRRISKFVEAAK